MSGTEAAVLILASLLVFGWRLMKEFRRVGAYDPSSR